MAVVACSVQLKVFVFYSNQMQSLLQRVVLNATCILYVWCFLYFMCLLEFRQRNSSLQILMEFCQLQIKNGICLKLPCRLPRSACLACWPTSFLLPFRRGSTQIGTQFNACRLSKTRKNPL